MPDRPFFCPVFLWLCLLAALPLGLRGQDAMRIMDLGEQAWRIRHANPAEAIRLGEQAIREADSLGLDALLPKLHNYTGVAATHHDDYRRALGHFRRSQEVALLLGDSAQYAHSLNNLGNLYNKAGDEDKGIKAIMDAAQMFQQLKNWEGLGFSYAQLHLIYLGQKNYERAAFYAQRALEVRRQNADQRGQGISLKALGHIERLRGNTALAVSHFEKAIPFFEAVGDTLSIGRTLMEMAESHAKTAPASAFDISQRAYAYFLALRSGGESTKALTLGMGLLADMGRPAEALALARQFDPAFAASGQNDVLADYYQALSGLHERLGNSAAAFEAYRRHTAYRDSVQGNEKAFTLGFLRGDFRAYQKELENELLKTKQAHAEEALQAQRQRSYFLLTLVAVLAVLLLIVYQSNRMLRSKNTRITRQQRQLEDKSALLAEREARLNIIFEADLIGVCLFDAQLRILDSNGKIAELFGSSREALLGRSLAELYSSTQVDRSQAEREMAAIMSGELDEVKQEDHIIVHQSQREVYIRKIIRPLREGPGGAVSGFIALVEDITEEQRARRSLENKMRELRSVLEYMPGWFFYVDKAGQVLEGNGQALAFMGIGHEALRGQHIHFADILPDAWATFLPFFQRTIEEGLSSRDILFEYTTPEGNSAWLILDYVPFRDSGGQIAGAMCYCTEVTELMQAQRKLADTQKALEQKVQELRDKNGELQRYIDSNLALESFAYVASHDMKEPLRTICSFSQLIKRRLGGNIQPELDEYLDFIVSASQNMNALIEDMLQYSRINSEAVALEWVAPEGIVQDVLRQLQDQIARSEARIDIGPLPARLRVQAVRFGQLLLNLFSNAMKFRRPGLPAHIRLSCTEEAAHWHFALSDNGIGIDASFSERIFLLFKRLHSKMDYEGTGIGLAVCKKIVEQHHGQIWVESVPGEGATFHFTIAKALPTAIAAASATAEALP